MWPSAPHHSAPASWIEAPFQWKTRLLALLSKEVVWISQARSMPRQAGPSSPLIHQKALLISPLFGFVTLFWRLLYLKKGSFQTTYLLKKIYCPNSVFFLKSFLKKPLEQKNILPSLWLSCQLKSPPCLVCLGQIISESIRIASVTFDATPPLTKSC